MDTTLATFVRDLLFTGAVAHGHPRYSAGKSIRRAKGKSTSSASSMTPQSREDLRVKPPTFVIPNRVPRQVSNLITWDVVKVVNQVATVANGITETNFSFSLNLHPQVSSWIALFDQWCIPQVSVSFESLTPAGSTVILPKLYTALDFDNATSLGSVSNLADFATCEATTLFPQMQLVRSIRPCVKVNTSGSNSSLARAWQDSAFPAILWFGIRSIVDNTNTPTVYNAVTATFTIWYAFRNQI